MKTNNLFNLAKIHFIITVLVTVLLMLALGRTSRIQTRYEYTQANFASQTEVYSAMVHYNHTPEKKYCLNVKRE